MYSPYTVLKQILAAPDLSSEIKTTAFIVNNIMKYETIFSPILSHFIITKSLCLGKEEYLQYLTA